MSPEERELLERTAELAEESNKILHSMRRSQRISSIMSFVYWIFIVGSAIGAYYFVQPYVDQVMSIYNSAKTNLDSIGNTFKAPK